MVTSVNEVPVDRIYINYTIKYTNTQQVGEKQREREKQVKETNAISKLLVLINHYIIVINETDALCLVEIVI